MTFKKIDQAASYLLEHIKSPPKIAIVLGSGLGSFAEQIENKTQISYSNIPHFGATSVQGHKGQLISGDIDGIPVMAFQGRFHYYEGHGLDQVTLPVRVLAKLGVKNLLLTNAAGSLNENFRPADLICIKDHINLTGLNPLIGPNISEIGVRFPDMGNAYNSEGIKQIKQAMQISGLEYKSGNYAWMTGPSYETPAEIKMLKTLGADLVGMSTVPEVIAAHHAGLKVNAISCVTNWAAGITNSPLSHKEVEEVAKQVEKQFSLLVKNLITIYHGENE